MMPLLDNILLLMNIPEWPSNEETFPYSIPNFIMKNNLH